MTLKQKAGGTEKPTRPASPWKKLYQNLEAMQVQRYRDLMEEGNHREIIFNLRETPTGVSALARLMQDADIQTMKTVIEIFRSASENKVDILHAVPALAKCLAMPDISWDAESALSSAAIKGTNISASIPALTILLSDQNPNMRIEITSLLGHAAKSGADITIAFEALVKGLSDTESIQLGTLTTFRVAAERGMDISVAIPALAKSLSDGSNPWETLNVLDNAAKYGINIGAAVTALANAFADPDPNFRLKAAQILEMANANGTDIDMAFPALFQAMMTNDGALRTKAFEILEKRAVLGDHNCRIALSSALLGLTGSKTFANEANQNSVIFTETIGALQRIVGKVREAEEKGKKKPDEYDEYAEEWRKEEERVKRDEEYEDYT